MSGIPGLASRRNVPLAMWNTNAINGTGTWATIYVAAAFENSIIYNTTNAQNDSIWWVIDLEAGTYNLAFAGIANNICAKAKFAMSFDMGQSWTDIGEIDTYNATLIQKRATISGITVPSTGPVLLRVKAEARNGAATGWTLELTRVDLTKVSG